MTKRKQGTKSNKRLDSIQTVLVDRSRSGLLYGLLRVRNTLEGVVRLVSQKVRLVVAYQKNTNRMRAVWFGSVLLVSFFATVFIVSQLYRIELMVKSFFYKDTTAQLKLALLTDSQREIDPVSILRLIDKNDADVQFIDYRSPSEYRASHIKGAVSIPLYTDFRNLYKTQLDKHTWFKQVDEKSKNSRFAIVYGYWEQSSINKQVVKMLSSQSGKYKVLSVGFNTFKNSYHVWMPGGDMNDPVVGTYLEGDYVEKNLLPQDGVPPLPVAPPTGL